MFGVGPQEMVIIGLIFLVIFGPGSLPKMAKDMGRFVSEARRAIDDFKEEITAAGDDERGRQALTARAVREPGAGLKPAPTLLFRDVEGAA